MKRFIYTTGMAFLLLLFPSYTFAKDELPQLKMEDHEEIPSTILIEQQSGQILYEKNMHEKRAPASMTKMMTLLLIMEAIDDGELTMDEQITVSERASSMGGSQVFLEVGEEMSTEDLIKAIAIASANDASVALAERIAGSEAAFVDKMNQKVTALNLENTHFTNASGLPGKNHYSTAYDMAMIARELLQYEDITKYTSIYEDYLREGKTNEFWLVNTNKLVRTNEYVDGLKTGYTKEAKFCLTASATKDGMRMITVVMGAEKSSERNEFTSQLLHQAFQSYEVETVVDENKPVATLYDERTRKVEYPLQIKSPITILKKKGRQVTEEVEVIHEYDDNIRFPIEKGTKVGKVIVQVDGETLAEKPLIVTEQVNYASIPTLFKRVIQEMTKTHGKEKTL
ncbi:MAG TPA: D-alanyl-D-alanine carboxypeptidase family protein [Pseudogracilibacillus sp.]|nr:D-alanyl-D-alanine carboxypeptidase family protein [Pseudogracilibacillus sp.]